ncbi:hypothetical protein P154DRAFT_538290 [Amniculicola lignicola CBS 123094]|uniref:Uncharacterized protein n=1 Tax=Amniculicola lignicola CBS 123094 TaxID=1392246 RepID=A0A6A5W2T3_9PLEO|nr:hypothetical protein P154DRAFT_538290 [Amniculicola lignicola CBS 123094]
MGRSKGRSKGRQDTASAVACVCLARGTSSQSEGKGHRGAVVSGDPEGAERLVTLSCLGHGYVCGRPVKGMKQSHAGRLVTQNRHQADDSRRRIFCSCIPRGTVPTGQAVVGTGVAASKATECLITSHSQEAQWIAWTAHDGTVGGNADAPRRLCEEGQPEAISKDDRKVNACASAARGGCHPIKR